MGKMICLHGCATIPGEQGGWGRQERPSGREIDERFVPLPVILPQYPLLNAARRRFSLAASR